MASGQVFTYNYNDIFLEQSNLPKVWCEYY
jgi:hypothetical protein